MIVEEHIEQLLAELRHAIDPFERQKIELELGRARSELNAVVAEQEQCQDCWQPT